jgi:hypothetical protein
MNISSIENSPFRLQKLYHTGALQKYAPALPSALFVTVRKPAIVDYDYKTAQACLMLEILGCGRARQWDNRTVDGGVLR